jgi:chromosomal replication initiator protein
VAPEFLRRNATPPPAVNPALTFDAFVVGDENRLAYKAARNAIVAPGTMNPLTLVAASGLGKTHLLSAIAHEAFEQGLAVIYAPAERFCNDFVRALNTQQIDAFRRRYRNVDLLLIDDIQFFEGRQKFQEEFFHTFNDLHAAGKQIVIAADRMPAQLAGLIDALRSRLQWGLAADLQVPAFETRLAILRAKAQQHAVQLADATLESIAQRCCPTVRQLEGYLNRVLAYAPLVGGKVTPEIIEKALSPLAAPQPLQPDAAPDADDVVAAVCRRTGIDAATLRGRSRSRDVTYARHLAMFLMKEDARKTVAEIGRHFGNRDHSTVLAGISRVALERTTRPETATDITAIRTALDTSATALAG